MSAINKRAQSRELLEKKKRAGEQMGALRTTKPAARQSDPERKCISSFGLPVLTDIFILLT